MERVAFCNTGSEAVTAAIRVARTVSGRDTIAMFAGAYHGVFDEVLVRPTRVDGHLRSMPIAPGIPRTWSRTSLVLDYGSPEALDMLRAHGSELAAVLVEPVQSRRPELQPRRVPPRGARDHREVRDGARLRRGRLGLPRPTRAAPRRCSASARTSRRTARSSAAVCRSASSRAAARTWTRSTAASGATATTRSRRSASRSSPGRSSGIRSRSPRRKAVLEQLSRRGPGSAAHAQRADARARERAQRAGGGGRRARARDAFASWFCFNFPPDVPYASLFYAYMRDKGIHVWEGRAGFLTTAHTDEDIARVVAAFEETLAEMQAADLLPGPGEPPVAGARRGHDANGREAWFVPDPAREGKYLQVEEARGNPWLTPSPSFARSTSTRSSRRPFATPSSSSPSRRRRCGPPRRWGARPTARTTSASRSSSTGRCGSSPCMPRSISVVARHEALRVVFAPRRHESDDPAPVLGRVAATRLSSLDSGRARAVDSSSLLDQECETPFDLAEGPLVRAFVVRESTDHHRFVLTVHHIVCDGWSSSVLFADLGTLYVADCVGIPAQLPRQRPIENYVAEQMSAGTARRCRRGRGLLGRTVPRRSTRSWTCRCGQQAGRQDLSQRPRDPADRRRALRGTEARPGHGRERRCSPRIVAAYEVLLSAASPDSPTSSSASRSPANIGSKTTRSSRIA